MVEVYYRLVREGCRTIEQVPQELREAVAARLNTDDAVSPSEA